MPDLTGTLTVSFNTIVETQNARLRRLEFDDYHHAITGADVGRIRKHTRSDDEIDPSTGKKKNSASRTLEWLLLNDVEYAQLHTAASDAVQEAATMLDTTKDLVETARAQIEAAINDVLDRAARLPDGRRVFRDVDGSIKDADGNVVSDADAATIQWNGDEPSYAEYRALVDHIRKIEISAQDLLVIEAELGAYQGDLNNNENPPSPDELGAVKDRADALRDRMSKIQDDLNAGHDRSAEAAQNVEALQTVERKHTIMPTIDLGN